MSLLTQYQLTQNTEFKQRVEVAVIAKFADIAQENSSGNASVDERRKKMVQDYLHNFENQRDLIVENFIQLVVTNPTIAAASDDADPNVSISDSDIDFVVAGFVNTVAGVNTNNSNV
jgi:hypothetical protein